MKQVTLTNDQIVAMKLALDRIDNGQRQQQGNATPDKSYSFPPKGIYWLGRLMSRVKSGFDDLETTRVKLVEKHLVEQKAAGIKNDQMLEGEFLAKFSREWQREVLTIKVTLELPELKLSLLALDKNDHFPTSVIRDLEPILVDDTDEQEKK